MTQAIEPAIITPQPTDIVAKAYSQDSRSPQSQLGIRKPLIAGFTLIAVFLGGFGAWAGLVPIQSAAIAPGVVSVDSKRKTVQHYEGGIVSQILVREGSKVEAGDVLLRLDQVQTRAKLGRLQAQHYASVAAEARLSAERDGRESVVFPDWLTAKAAEDPAVAEILAGQLRIFEVRWSANENNKAILEQRIAQLKEEIAGLQAEIRSQDYQSALIDEEIAGVQKLYKKGLEKKPRLLALQRASAEIAGARAQNSAQIAQARQTISETELQISAQDTKRLDEAVEQLRETQTVINDLNEQIEAAEDVLRRTDIVAPVSGTVMNLRHFTLTGVVAPGEPILEIVPSNDTLVLEAHVKPTDVDVVHPGLPAEVRLTAFNQRHTPTFVGKVEQVSADRLTDEKTGQVYYLAKVSLDPHQPRLNEVDLYPGMPAEVMIRTGKRTAFNYILEPVTASLNRSMREE